jgi:hypothetical protein
MAKIAIIDDNPDHSGTVKNNIELALAGLESSIEVISTLPFKDINDYFPFFTANDVCMLILDEKLNDQAVDADGPVSYKGSELVSALRVQLKDMPIFALTVIPDENNLVQKFSEYEQIISRDEFYKNSEKYVPIFVRAAKSYLKDNESDLSKFNDLTKMIAGGDDGDETLQKLQALQVKMELPFSGFADRSAWLDEYEKQISSLEEINQLLKKKLAGK